MGKLIRDLNRYELDHICYRNEDCHTCPLRMVMDDNTLECQKRLIQYYSDYVRLSNKALKYTTANELEAFFNKEVEV